MRTSSKGLEILEHFEGLSLKPYYCPAGIATIGFGSTFYDDGSKVKISDNPITFQRARELKKFALKGFEVGVLKHTKVYLNQEMFDALVCFCYNLGLGNYRASTLRMKLNRGEYDSVYEQFLRWNKAGGTVLRGLTRRRIAEGNLFNEGVKTMGKGVNFFSKLFSL